jgi:hypothetical protein
MPHEWRVPRYGIPQRAILQPPATTLPSWLVKFAKLDLQLLEMQCWRPPTLTLQRASYPRINHLNIFPHFSPDLSQGPRFVSVTGKLGVPDPSSIQSELDRWFQVLRSPRRKELVVPLH